MNPAAVRTIIIGVDEENPDGAGLVFIDDIRIVRPRPIDPGNVGVAAH